MWHLSSILLTLYISVLFTKQAVMTLVSIRFSKNGISMLNFLKRLINHYFYLG